MTRGLIEDGKTSITWNLPRVLMPKNRVKLLLNMVFIAAQTIPRGGMISIDPIGEGEAMSFKVKASGTNAKLPQAVPALLKGEAGDHAVDAHAIQPFYTGLLARNCGLTAGIAAEGEAIVVSAQ